MMTLLGKCELISIGSGFSTGAWLCAVLRAFNDET